MFDRLLYSILALGFAAVLVAVYFIDPSEGGIFPPCPTHYITHYYCPGCGTLRALHALVHGDFKEAFSQNALAIVFLPILPAMVLFPRLFRAPIVPIAIFVIFVVYTILRNTEQFAFLAPH